jgi:hypothetical protein
LGPFLHLYHFPFLRQHIVSYLGLSVSAKVFFLSEMTVNFFWPTKKKLHCQAATVVLCIYTIFFQSIIMTLLSQFAMLLLVFHFGNALVMYSFLFVHCNFHIKKNKTHYINSSILEVETYNLLVMRHWFNLTLDPISELTMLQFLVIVFLQRRLGYHLHNS